MNILFHCDEYPPAKAGGIGTVVKIVAESLVKKNHKVFIVGIQQYSQDLPFESIINGVTITRPTHYTEISLINRLPSYLKRYVFFLLKKVGIMHNLAHKSLRETEKIINELIVKEKIDVLELNDYMICSQYFNRVVTFANFLVPTVIRVHGSKSFIQYNNKNKINKNDLAIDINNYSRANYICAVSKYSADFLIRQLNLPDSKISVIYNPIENNFLYLDCKRKSYTQNIIFLGKIIETKGAFTLIKAFNFVASKHPNISLTLIGGGEIKKAKKYINKKNVDRVFFPGYVDRVVIKKLLLNSLFCVLPSHFENFSMAALEILACGRALIYTDRSSGPELIENNINGILIDPEDENILAEKMLFLIENEKIREKMACLGYKRVKDNFSQTVIVAELEKYYYSIIN